MSVKSVIKFSNSNDTVIFFFLMQSNNCNKFYLIYVVWTHGNITIIEISTYVFKNSFFYNHCFVCIFIAYILFMSMFY